MRAGKERKRKDVKGEKCKQKELFIIARGEKNINKDEKRGMKKDRMEWET